MPFYNHNRNTKRARPNGALPNQPSLGYRQTGVRRHEFTSGDKNTTSLTAGDYVTITNLRFKRSFSTTIPDVEPTPTDGNNFQSSSVMNGSRIMNFRKRITIRNNQSTGAATGTQKTVKYDLYELVFSFWDAYLFEQYGQDAGLGDKIVDFDGTTVSENVGEVDWNAVHPLLTNNMIKNSKFLQRYMKHRGQISVAAGEQVELFVNRIPPACRRSQTGMFWGFLLLNDTIENQSEAIVSSISSETSFEEIPADERLPFLY